MTLQIKCRCGGEFYLSVVREDFKMSLFAQERYNDFMSMHKQCSSIVDDEFVDDNNELPEDWKV